MPLLLKIIGWIIIVSGLIVGIYAGNLVGEIMEEIFGRQYGGFQWDISIGWWLSGIITGIMFIAFGMMLERLYDLQDRVYSLQKEIVHPKEKSLLSSLAAEKSSR